MLDDRKAAILRAVVQEYIATAQPVGSAHVASSASLPVSSATVRNEMVTLEREGYLIQPHTSAGRIPTDKGYRFFVDQLAPGGALPAAKRQQVRDFFNQAHGELERTLHDTSQLLSRITDYVALVVPPAHEGTAVRSVQIVRLSPQVAMVVAVLSNGMVQKATIEFDQDVGEERIGAATSWMSSCLLGRTLAELPAVPASGDAVVDGLVASACDVLRQVQESDSDQVYVGGASRMAAAFDAMDTVRRVLDIVEQQYVVVTLLRDLLDRGLNVSIGAELGVQPLADCSVVVAPFAGEGDVAGAIGVLGPTRMNYPQAMAAVAVVSQRLGSRLSEG